MKKPPSFFVPGPLAKGAIMTLSAAELRHARARRLRPGSQVRLIDGHGGVAEGEIEHLDRSSARVRVEAFRAPRGDVLPIAVFAPALRPARLSWLIEKATELGATKIVLTRSARAQGDRTSFAARESERLATLAREAAKQCGRLQFPTIEGPVGFDEVVVSSADCRILFDAEGAAFPSSLRAKSLALWVGPEGGFTPEELRASESAGWMRVRLAGATLRAETAVLAGLALAARAIDSAADRADNGPNR
jgi:16S rRNA (uracil1498-N3)-methyltransferase